MNDTASPKAAATSTLAPETPPANSPTDHAALVERWWEDHFPGSAVAAVTAAWNHAFAAKEELKRRLADPNLATLKQQEH